MKRTAPLPAQAELAPERGWVRSHRPSSALSFIIAFFGLIAFFAVHWLVGVGLFLLAVVVERTTYSCSECGNAIVKSSRLCPTCLTPLDKPRNTTIKWLLIGLLLLGVFGYIAFRIVDPILHS